MDGQKNRQTPPDNKSSFTIASAYPGHIFGEHNLPDFEFMLILVKFQAVRKLM